MKNSIRAAFAAGALASATPEGTIAQCTAKPGAKGVMIPSQVLAAFGSEKVFVSAKTIGQQTVTSGEWATTVTSQNDVMRPNGKKFIGASVTFVE